VRPAALALVLFVGSILPVRAAPDGSAAFSFALSRLSVAHRVRVVQHVRYSHERRVRSSGIEYIAPHRVLTTSLMSSGGAWTQVQVGNVSCAWFGHAQVARCDHNPWGGTPVSTWVRGLLISPALSRVRFSSSVQRRGKHRGALRITVTGRGDPYFCPPEGNCAHQARGLRRSYHGVLLVNQRTGLPITYISYALERKKRYRRQSVRFDFAHAFTVNLPAGSRVPCTGGSAGDWCVRRRS
jgi:hypothetical protein